MCSDITLLCYGNTQIDIVSLLLLYSTVLFVLWKSSDIIPVLSILLLSLRKSYNSYSRWLDMNVWTSLSNRLNFKILDFHSLRFWFVHISLVCNHFYSYQWVTDPTHSCIFLNSFWSNLLPSLFIWLTLSSPPLSLFLCCLHLWLSYTLSVIVITLSLWNYSGPLLIKIQFLSLDDLFTVMTFSSIFSVQLFFLYMLFWHFRVFWYSVLTLLQ